jgi:4-hydroxybenzoate polyprenyltransferase
MLTMTPITALLRDIKFSHTIFAMPFAILGGFMAATETAGIVWGTVGGQIGLIVVCMIFARTVAMLANRILDSNIDLDNPRTAQRAIPSGKATQKTAMIFLGMCSVLFIASTAGFGFLWDNWVPLTLSVPVLVWLITYPLIKRFSWMCHLYLGATLAMSPIAAAVAIDPSFVSLPQIWLLSAMVMCWVAGFDIIYALQDVQSDREHRIYSMPASLGEGTALWISKVLHLASVAFLYGVYTLDPQLNGYFLFGVIVVAVVLAFEHLTVKRWGTTKMAMTFFTLNGVVSCLLGVAGVIDLLAGQ